MLAVESCNNAHIYLEILLSYYYYYYYAENLHCSHITVLLQLNILSYQKQPKGTPLLLVLHPPMSFHPPLINV